MHNTWRNANKKGAKDTHTQRERETHTQRGRGREGGGRKDGRGGGGDTERDLLPTPGAHTKEKRGKRDSEIQIEKERRSAREECAGKDCERVCSAGLAASGPE